MTPATIELILAALRLGISAYNQIELMDLEKLPPDVKEMLLFERDRLTVEIRRLDNIGGELPWTSA